MMQVIPVIIIGGGPAGVATAISLRQQGIDCLVIESADNALPKQGETISPNARIVLQKLGLLELVDHPSHANCVGNTIYWGNELQQSRPFFAEPYGNGWHLDRVFFEQQLKETAVKRKVEWLAGWHCISTEFKNDHWQVVVKNIEGESKVFNTNFIVDATGRAARIARMQGATRKSIDRLTGYCSYISSKQDVLGSSTFIESVANGWWYAAPLKNGSTVVNFMSDTDLHELTANDLCRWLFSQLQQTTQLKNHIRIDHPNDLSAVQIKPASVSRLHDIAGKNWLAVGDAAFSYDPLSSYGITAALGGGIYAGLAIGAWLNKEAEALDAYRYVQQQAFDNCQVLLRNQYSLETRWADVPFWSRRQRKTETV